MTTAQCRAQHRDMKISEMQRRLLTVGIVANRVIEPDGFYLYAENGASIQGACRADTLLWPFDAAEALLDQIGIFGRATSYSLVLRDDQCRKYCTLVVPAGAVPVERAYAYAASMNMDVFEFTEIHADGR